MSDEPQRDMDPTTPESIALTMRTDFEHLTGGLRTAVLREAHQVHQHHVQPLLDELERLRDDADDGMTISMVRKKGTDKHWSGGPHGSWCSGTLAHVYSSPAYAELPIKAMARECSREDKDAEVVRYRLVEVEVVDL